MCIQAATVSALVLVSRVVFSENTIISWPWYTPATEYDIYALTLL